MPWTLVYSNNGDGTTAGGNKEDLLRAVRRGQDIKIKIVYPNPPEEPEKKVTVVSPKVVFTNYGDVFAQVSWAPVEWDDADRETMTYLAPAEYMLILSTTGKANRRSLSLPSATPSGEIQRYALAWYVNA